MRAKCSDLGVRKLLLVMRLTAILFVFCLQVSANLRSQEKITMNVKNASLESVLKEIGRQTGYQYAMQDQWKDVAKKINITVSDASLPYVLEVAFGNQSFTYEIIQKIIVVREKPKSAVHPISQLPNNNQPDVRGVVFSDKGDALSGATVEIIELRISGQTNSKGEFTLQNIPNGKFHLSISFVGYEKQIKEFVVTENMIKIVVKLKQMSNTLDETVIKGYYNTTQRLNTGNVATVKGEDIQKQPVSDPMLALIGRVAGLNIQETRGLPGANMIVQIRGVNSLFSGLDPFYIVDGVPYSSTSLTSPFVGGGAAGFAGRGSGLSPFNNLNPADIERIEVLKDADATAIYGSRGANGVILITTKKGKIGDTKVDINVYTGAGKVPPMRGQFLNTPQYLAMRHEALNNDGKTVGSTDYDINGGWDTTRFTDWQKTLIGNTVVFTNAQANISGGDANTQFLIGGGYSKQGTAFPGEYSDRKGSLHFNLTHSSLNHLFHTQLSASYVNDNSNLPQTDFSGGITLAPDAPALYDANGNLNFQIVGGTPTFLNPIAETRRYAKAITDNLISNLSLTYQLLPSLQLKSNFGYSHGQMNQTLLTPDTYYPPPFNDNPNYRVSLFATSESKSLIIEPQANYYQKIGNGVLEGLVGATFQQNTFTALAQSAYGFSSDALITNPSAATYYSNAGNTNTIYHYTAAFGRLNYNWKDKYLLNITARRDGSSRFGPGKQFGNFGAAGAAWIFSSEPFVENALPFLSFGKFRASYGTTGNDQIPDYQFLSTYVSNSMSYQQVVGLIPVQLANSTLSWERVNKLEGGIELGFLKDRISFSTSYYRNRTNNQLIPYTLPQITGFSSIQANLPAIVQNSGVEFLLNTINVRTKDFIWKSAINLSIERNKLIAFPDLTNSPYANAFSIGKSILSVPVYHYQGVNDQSGIYTFATKNASGQPSYPDDLIFSKPITQHYYGGFQNSFSYKGFQLDLLIRFVNQTKFSYSRLIGVPGAYNSNQLSLVLNRWQAPGNITNTQKFTTNLGTPAGIAFQNFANFPSDGVIVDGSFMRLQSLAFSYLFPTDWQKKAHLQNARIYLQCQNLLTITGYKGLDPETGGLLPPNRMLTAGLQMAF